MTKFLSLTAFILLICCCTKPNPNEEKTFPLSYADSIQIRIDSLLTNSFPILGYRFIITGDFNGDNKQDTLVEHYTDSLKTKEVAKYDTVCDYFDSWALADLFDKKSFLSNTTNSFKELKGGILGFVYIENCGDVSGDGIDDLFVVPHIGGASNCIRGHFYTLKNNAWEELWNTGVWQWQFPPTPDATIMSVLFGNFDVGYCTNDSTNWLLEDTLKKYRFVKRNPNYSIEYECRNSLDYYEMDSLYEIYGEHEAILKRFLQKNLSEHYNAFKPVLTRPA